MLMAYKNTPAHLDTKAWLASRTCMKKMYLEAHEDPSYEDSPLCSAEVLSLAQVRDDFLMAIDAEGLSLRSEDDALELFKPGRTFPIMGATFTHSRLAARIDLMRYNSSFGWNIWIVHDGDRSEEDVYMAAAFQMYVLALCDIVVDRIYLLEPNPIYRMRGQTPCPKMYFQERDIYQNALDYVVSVQDETPLTLPILDSVQAPDSPCGGHCRFPRRCEHFSECSRGKGDNWVGFLPRLSKATAYEFSRQGIETIEQIPATADISDNARVLTEIDWSKRKGTALNPDVKSALATLQYPICALDFETLRPKLPFWQGSRPSEYIPFQFSTCRVDRPGGAPRSGNYLPSDATDWREELLVELIEQLRDVKTVVVYFQRFEQTRLEELATQFPAYKNEIREIIEKLWDLYPVIKENTADIRFHGSYSLKAVLPVLCSELDYQGLEVQDGLEAGRKFRKYLSMPESDPRKAEIRQSLLDYCGLDTLGLIRIIEKLQAAVDSARRPVRNTPPRRSTAVR